MSETLTIKAARALPWLVLVLTLLAGSLPAGATLPSWQEVSAVNQEGLVAAARKYLSPQEVGLLEQAISKEERYTPGAKKISSRPSQGSSSAVLYTT